MFRSWVLCRSAWVAFLCFGGPLGLQNRPQDPPKLSKKTPELYPKALKKVDKKRKHYPREASQPHAELKTNKYIEMASN